MERDEKVFIYQVFPRIFGNRTHPCVKHGSLQQNGSGKFDDFTSTALKEIKDFGITHVWYTGVIEHATKTDYTVFGISKDHDAVVKGKAGSPYAIKDYYDVTPDLAREVPNRMAEFEALVDRTHEAGLKVIIDFVPNHVARQYHSDAKNPLMQDLGQNDQTHLAFDPNNNFYYLPGQTLQLHFGAQQEDFEYSEFPAKVTGNDCFSAHPGQNDWYETVKLNYGIDFQNGKLGHFYPVPDTWKKMLDILRFWLGKGVDGFRCDMAEMVPIEFWEWVIPRVRSWKNVIFIAEVYHPSLYRDFLKRGQFDYLYDKVGLYDTLREVMCGRAPAGRLTECWQAVDDIRPHMLAFLENHDEQRIASDFFAGEAQAGIPAFLTAATMGTNPVMIYCGQELGERGMDEEGFSGRDGRTTIFDYWSLECLRKWNNDGRFDEGQLTDEQKTLRRQYAAILRIAAAEKAICQGKFFDLMYVNRNNPYFDPHRQYAFLRKSGREVLLIVANFDRTPRTVRVNIPDEAFRSLPIPDNQAAELTDLFSGTKTVGTLTAACPYEMALPACSGRILKFHYNTQG